jgi:hypothetical protein
MTTDQVLSKSSIAPNYVERNINFFMLTRNFYIDVSFFTDLIYDDFLYSIDLSVLISLITPLLTFWISSLLITNVKNWYIYAVLPEFVFQRRY